LSKRELGKEGGDLGVAKEQARVEGEALNRRAVLAPRSCEAGARPPAGA